MPTPGSRSRRGIEERKSEHRHPPGVPPAERAARFFGAPTGTRRTGARRVTRPGIRRVFGGGTRLRSTNRSKPDSGVRPPGTQPPGIGVGPVFGARRSRSRTGKRIEEPGSPPVPGGPSRPDRRAAGRRFTIPETGDGRSNSMRGTSYLSTRAFAGLGAGRPGDAGGAGRSRRDAPSSSAAEPGATGVVGTPASSPKRRAFPEPGACGPGSGSRCAGRESKKESEGPVFPGVSPAARAARALPRPDRRATGRRPGIRRVFGGGTNWIRRTARIPIPASACGAGYPAGRIWGRPRLRCPPEPEPPGKENREPGPRRERSGPSRSRPARDGPPPHDSGSLRQSKELDSRNLISLGPGVRRLRRRSAGRRRPRPGGLLRRRLAAEPGGTTGAFGTPASPPRRRALPGPTGRCPAVGAPPGGVRSRRRRCFRPRCTRGGNG